MLLIFQKTNSRDLLIISSLYLKINNYNYIKYEENICIKNSLTTQIKDIII